MERHDAATAPGPSTAPNGPADGPNLLVIGAARSGTTALCAALADHRDIFFSVPKEVHFFANAGRPVHYRGPGDDLSINRALITDPERFNALFADAGDHQLRGEGSVSTLYHPDRSIPAIRANASRDVRLIAVLRHPANRAYSSYLYLRSRGFEHLPTFEQALDEEDRRRDGGYHHLWHLRAMGRYARQLPPFVEAFGDRLLILIQEEYRDRPEETLDRVHRFLDLDPLVPLRALGDTNRGGVPRSDLLVSVMNGLRRTPGAQQLVRTATPRALRERVRSANLERPEMDPLTEARLRAEFRPDVAAVEELLGRTITAWRRR
ncbi:MAG: sulfotransferase [Actinomycetota bacterium]